jgi:hypothetical protein
LLLFAGQAVVQFAQGVGDNRAYAIKFFLQEESFYAEAALYVAVFPHLKKWLSNRAAEALTQIEALPGSEGERKSEAAKTMQTAGARFLPQVHASGSLLLLKSDPDGYHETIKFFVPAEGDALRHAARSNVEKLTWQMCCRWKHCGITCKES